MRVLIHQALNDCRAQKQLVLVWLAVLGLDGVVYGLGLDSRLGIDDIWTHDWLFASRGILGLALGAYAWLLAVRIVHADPLDGTSAFWLTRPITPRVLLVSKLGLIAGILLVLPAAVAVTIELANGVAFATACRAAAEWAVLDAALLLPVVLVAAMTRDIARVAIVAVTLLLIRTSMRGSGRVAPSTWSTVSRDPGAVDSAFVVVLVLVVIASVALIAHQYLTRRRPRTLALTLAVLPVLVAVAGAWGWNVLPALAPGPVDSRTFDASRIGVSVSVDQALARYGPQPNGPGRVAKLYGSLDVTGVPDGWAVLSGRGRGDMRFADGGTSAKGEWDTRYLSRYTSHEPDLAWEYPESAERLLGARLTRRRGPTPAYKYCLFELPEGTFTREVGRPAEYTAELTFSAFKATIAAVLPLRAGSEATVESHRFAVVERGRGGRGEWVVRIRSSSPRLVLTHREPRLTLVLRNPRRREATQIPNFSPELPGIGPASCALALESVPIVTYRGKLWGFADETWLADAELVVIQVEDKGWFTKRVTVPNFIVPQLATTEFPYR